MVCSFFNVILMLVVILGGASGDSRIDLPPYASRPCWR
jgi:hypothetical protein